MLEIIDYRQNKNRSNSINRVFLEYNPETLVESLEVDLTDIGWLTIPRKRIQNITIYDYYMVLNRLHKYRPVYWNYNEISSVKIIEKEEK